MDGNTAAMATGALALVGYLAVFERRLSRIEGKFEMLVQQVQRLLNAISGPKD